MPVQSITEGDRKRLTNYKIVLLSVMKNVSMAVGIEVHKNGVTATHDATECGIGVDCSRLPDSD